MAMFSINFRKEFGQNFLTNKMVVEDIADNCADTTERMILEIGPGIGCLTQELALRFKKVVAVEIDRGLIPILDKTMAEYDNVTVINDDIMKVDLAALVEEYADGMPGYSLKKDDIARMANYDIEVDRYLEKCVQGPLPFNGYYVECSKYNGDIVLRLRDKYDWIVLRNPNEIRKGMTKLSFRTRRTDVDLGKVLASYNMGGGGHPGAGGQIVETRVVPMFILDVAVKAFGKEADYGI